MTFLKTNRRMRRRIRKFAHKQTDKEQTNNRQFKYWDHSNPLWIVGRAGQLLATGADVRPLSGDTISGLKIPDIVAQYTRKQPVSIFLKFIQFQFKREIQAGADITGQLQVRPMLYTLYIDINLRDGSKTETTLSSVDTRGSWPITVLYCTLLYCTV